MLFNLFLVFLLIGALAFGSGYATLPLIEKYIVNLNNWIDYKTFLDIIVISQMTPGSVAINAATFVGQKVAGLPGSILATTGVVIPQSAIMLYLGHELFDKNKKYKLLDYFIVGVKSCVVSLIFLTTISLFKTSIIKDPLNYAGIVTFILALFLQYKKIDTIKIIIISAVVGLVFVFI